MNYNHLFHAGNFADVLKHSLLVLTLTDLQNQKKPFFVLDTHSGRGRYNLLSPEAKRSKESDFGILSLQKNEAIADFIKPYLQTVTSFNPTGKINIYPGSPAIIQKFLRKKDVAAFCELNEKEFLKLHALLHDDQRIKTIRGDGYEALMSFLPPREKGGLVLIDPPFEKRDEILRLEEAILKSLKKWPNGTFMLWYPVKDYINFEQHIAHLRAHSDLPMELFTLSLPRILAKNDTALRETAILVINPTDSILKYKDDIQNLGDTLFETVLPSKIAADFS